MIQLIFSGGLPTQVDTGVLAFFVEGPIINGDLVDLFRRGLLLAGNCEAT
ncbi:hypothetical protein P3T69_12525 [Lactiplantibacillus plantarum]|jgi:hypothetical protein|nr:hypothetical protein [Lactiplantibacillus plantarum]WEZ93984.1 hypothetical protein P3T69_12525 [Lactiplantibacillus plantarum]